MSSEAGLKGQSDMWRLALNIYHSICANSETFHWTGNKNHSKIEVAIRAALLCVPGIIADNVRKDGGYMYGWLIGGLAALDLGIKSEIERQEDDAYPRDLPCAKGLIKLHKSHNEGFPFGFLKERPELVKGVPVMVVSAVAGALGMLMARKGSTAQKIGLSMVLGGAASNLYDRLKRGYVVDYFSIECKNLKKVIFNLGDMFVFLGSALFLIAETVSSFGETAPVREKKVKKEK